ncbi:MAG: 3-(methylthio)propionyl-CoA ligase [Gammaproteobacteria bacterium]
MLGLMMDMPLLISSLIQHADEYHGDTEITTRTVEGPLHRYTYREAHQRARQLANALDALGIRFGDRCATLAWNTHRHFEIYFAVSGIGAICHTVNPRLFAPQIAYIINHAEDSCLFVDLPFVSLVEELADQLATIKTIVILTDQSHMPRARLANVICYEELVHSHSDSLDWPQFDENTGSSLCYTSGTTGHPKGVLYSHRSTLLHTYAVCLPDAFGLAATDTVMPVVPMYHANAWGIPYVAPMVGCKLVLPGPVTDGAGLHQLIESEQVTLSAAVPTVWLGLLQYLDKSGRFSSSLERVVIGGSAPPRSMIEAFAERFRIQVLHAWGMTETSPIGTINSPKHGLVEEPPTQRYERETKQGRPLFGVRMRIVDDQNLPLPRDGASFGDLEVQGPWVCGGYFNELHSDAHSEDGWFSTGDVATIDPQGYMQITDRSKDVIKSGGEWISSIALENIAIGHPEVVEAAAIGAAHAKWEERPLLIVVRRGDSTLTRDEILRYFEGKVAKWWIPDDAVFVDELPHTATGKLFKLKLREKYKNHLLTAKATS